LLNFRNEGEIPDKAGACGAYSIRQNSAVGQNQPAVDSDLIVTGAIPRNGRYLTFSNKTTDASKESRLISRADQATLC
jgi:hypothetical protein